MTDPAIAPVSPSGADGKARSLSAAFFQMAARRDLAPAGKVLINGRTKEGLPRGFFGYDYRQLQVDPDWKPDESQAFPVVMTRGPCLIFWSTLMHASLPNVTRKDYRMGFAARYVPSSVRIYPDTDHVEEYGGRIPLTRYSAVLVSGDDRHGLNRISGTNLLGEPFARR